MKTQWYNRNMVILLLGITTMFLSSCDLINGKDDDPDDEVIMNEVDVAIEAQEDIMDALVLKMTQTDTFTAIDEVVGEFASHPDIAEIRSTPDGISVEYETGLWGVLLVSPGEEEEGFGEGPVFETRNGITPARSSAMILHSDYANIREYGDRVIDEYEFHLLEPNYSSQVRRGQAFNVDFLANMTGYGIIQFFSHGLLYNSNPELSALATGEIFDKFNYSTILKYQKDYKSGLIGFLTKMVNGSQQHRFVVVPEFISKYNDFSPDSTFILGGFCYSGTGSWADEMDKAGALGYLGYDWKLGARTWENWTKDMIAQMCDTNQLAPVSIGDWLDQKVRQYVSTSKVDPKNVTTDIVFKGNRDLTLWELEERGDILRVDVDLYISDATFKFVQDSSVTMGTGAHRAFISSREGSNSYNEDTRVWKTTFDKTWFGTTYSGEMTINLGPSDANVQVNRVGVGSTVTETYVISKSSVPYSSAESDAKTRVYYMEGAAACANMITSYKRESPNVVETLEDYQCGPTSYFRIEVVYL